MINKKTVFVLGSGSNVLHRFPTAIQLRAEIIENGVNYIRKLTKEFHYSSKDYHSITEKFVNTFSRSSTNSIDRFLNEQNEDFVKVGKVLILYILKLKESKSVFNEDVDHNQDWYRYFYNFLVMGIQDFHDISFGNFEIITFNYDRSFEYYLYTSLRNHYPYEKASDKEIISLMRSLKIHHVFGKIDEDLWFSRNHETEIESEYRSQYIHLQPLLQMTENINIINEVEIDTAKYRAILDAAAEIYYLGFGYHVENMKILGSPFISVNPKTKVYGTAMGFSEQNILRLTNNNYRFLNESNMKFLTCDCYTLLSDYL